MEVRRGSGGRESVLNPLAGLSTCPTCAKGGNVWRSRVSSAFPFSAKLDGEFIPLEIDPPEFLARAYFYSSPSSAGSRTPLDYPPTETQRPLAKWGQTRGEELTRRVKGNKNPPAFKKTALRISKDSRVHSLEWEQQGAICVPASFQNVDCWLA